MTSVPAATVPSAPPSSVPPADAVMASPPPSTPETSVAGRYWRLWRKVPRELGYLVVALPIAMISLWVLSALIGAGAGLIFLIIGIFIVVGALFVARAFGMVELTRLRWAGRKPIPEPAWIRPNARPGFIGACIDALANPHSWLYYIHGVLVSPILSTISWTITVIWVSVSFSLIATPFWGLIHPPYDDYSGNTIFGGARTPPPDWTNWNVADFGAYGLWGVHDPAATGWLIALTTLAGFGLLALLPFITRGLVMAHYGVGLMLARFRSEELRTEVAALSQSRAAAVAAEDHSLRRLERDIHDGPQQRLVRLQMDLASAERRMDDDPQYAKDLLASARQLSQEALEELRALSRGFAPPILQDRGLAAGLESLAARSVVPVVLTNDLGDIVLPSEIERSAYFVVAELLSNVAKHSGATSATVSAALRRDPGVDTTWLDLAVSDNGRGGAASAAGHGLAGLEERLVGLRGILTVTSPAGGPTVIEAHLPLTSAAASSVADGGGLPGETPSPLA